MANIYVQGVDYYYLNSDQGAELAAYLSSHNYNFEDFGGFVIDSGNYAGYYFNIGDINDDEYDLLESYAGGVLDTRAIFDSVQAHYFVV